MAQTKTASPLRQSSENGTSPDLGGPIGLDDGQLADLDGSLHLRLPPDRLRPERWPDADGNCRAQSAGGSLRRVFVDRYDRRKIMMTADILRAILIFLCPSLFRLNVIWLYVIVMLTSAVSQFFDPGL